jgi:drug/metabolite transporter (DMT)-like permease
VNAAVTDRDRAPAQGDAGDIRAKAMLVLNCIIWGITWPLMKIALEEIPPLTMRTLSAALGALTLYLVCLAQRRSFRLRTAKDWAHVTIASILNVVCFALFSAFAQLQATTSRVTILAYTTPIWTVLLAWPFLGERPTRIQTTALGLCAAGIAILIYPLAAAGIPPGILLGLGIGVTWGAGTVYLKWAHIEADPMGVASWQMTIAFVVIAACLLLFDGRLNLEAAHPGGLAAMIFVGIVGNGVAYGLWFAVVRRMSAATATLGSLSVPTIGILSSFLILGEVPTVSDMIGFVLIFAASACILLTPQRKILSSDELIAR